MKKSIRLTALIILFAACKKVSTLASIANDDQVSSTIFREGPTVEDVDGNVYNSFKIGTQTWMKKNLKVTRYRNGDPIPKVNRAKAWSKLETGAYCNYNNEANNISTYGRLYNWFAVTDIRNIAPAGWHIPGEAEWIALINYLGGASIAGGKLKEAGLAHWLNPNYADNSSGFTALPGGSREADGTFNYLGGNGYWWSSAAYDTDNAMYLFLYSNYEGTNWFNDNKRSGFSVRCVKD